MNVCFQTVKYEPLVLICISIRLHRYAYIRALHNNRLICPNAGASDSLIDCNGAVDECPPVVSPMTSSNIQQQPQHHRQKQSSPDNREPLPAEAITSTPTDEVKPMSVVDGSIAAVATASGQSAAVEVCAGCRRPIIDRYLLRAVDRNWHEDCLRCSCCDCRLGEVGSTLFTRSNLLLCRRDYLR